MFKAVSVLRNNLKMAQARYNRSKTYPNALAVQQAKAELEAHYQSERRAFAVIEGGLEDQQEDVHD